MILQDSEPRGARIESHTATMTRRELFSAWLEEGVQKVADDRVRAAREKSDHLGKYFDTRLVALENDTDRLKTDTELD